MKPTDIYRFVCHEDGSATLMAQILGNAGTAITQASLSAITCRVSLASDESQVVAPTVTISSTVFDTLQTEDDDPRWTLDDTGYNFAHTLPATAFPTGNVRYLIHYKFAPASGDPFFFLAEAFAVGHLLS